MPIDVLDTSHSLSLSTLSIAHSVTWCESSVCAARRICSVMSRARAASCACVSHRTRLSCTHHLTPHTSQGMVWRAAVHLTNTHHTRTLEIHQTHDRHAAESSRWQGILMPCSCRPCSCLALTHLAVQHGRVPKGRGANGCVNGRLRLMWPCLLLLPAQSGGNRGLLSCRMLLGTNVLGRILTARLQTARLELSQDQLPKRNMRTTSHNQSFKD